MNSIKVKIVNAYPIEVSILGQQGQIVKVISSGFLVRTKQPLSVGEQISGDFVLPVLNVKIQFQGVVMKTHDQFVGKLGASDENLKLAEVGFRKISVGAGEKIKMFCAKIGQENR